jgi:hypothetical protein
MPPKALRAAALQDTRHFMPLKHFTPTRNGATRSCSGNAFLGSVIYYMMLRRVLLQLASPSPVANRSKANPGKYHIIQCMMLPILQDFYRKKISHLRYF